MTETLVDTETIGGVEVSSVEEEDHFVNQLIYGESGAGKTVLAGSASVVEGMSPVLFIDIEGGTLSLRQFYPQVRRIRVTSFNKLQAVYNELYKGDSPYKTVVVDSLTEAQKLSMVGIMKEAHSADRDIDPEVPRIRDWGKNIEQIRRFVRGMRDLPMNVIFTALVNSDKDNRGRTTARPMMQGKLASEVPGFMDIVTYLYVRSKDGQMLRLLLSQQTDNALAKDRSNKLPPILENPTMNDIYSRVVGDKSDA